MSKTESHVMLCFKMKITWNVNTKLKSQRTILNLLIQNQQKYRGIYVFLHHDRNQAATTLHAHTWHACHDNQCVHVHVLTSHLNHSNMNSHILNVFLRMCSK